MKRDSTNEVTYLLATIISLTERGGRVTTATGGSAIAGLGMARVGDFIEYAGGTRARIMTGVDLPDTPAFRALAVVDSVLDSGDVINDSPDRQNRVPAFVPVRFSISVH